MSNDTNDATGVQLRAALKPTLGPEIETLDGDAHLPTYFEERYDSLAAMECVSRVEECFGVEVDFVEHDVRYWFSTLNRMEQFVADALEDRQQLSGDV